MRDRKATMLCHQTKDILYVMKFLGHKNIKNTLIYTDLIEFGAEEEYHIKVAKTLKEACELAKAGFEYFTEIDGARSSENAHVRAHEMFTKNPKP